MIGIKKNCSVFEIVLLIIWLQELQKIGVYVVGTVITIVAILDVVHNSYMIPRIVRVGFNEVSQQVQGFFVPLYSACNQINR